MTECQQNLSSKLVILTPGQLASIEAIWGCHGAMVCHPNFSNLDQDTLISLLLMTPTCLQLRKVYAISSGITPTKDRPMYGHKGLAPLP